MTMTDTTPMTAKPPKSGELSGKFWPDLWRIVRSTIMGRENDSLRFTQTSGMELDMEKFLKREDVKERIREMIAFSKDLEAARNKGRKTRGRGRKKATARAGSKR